MGTFSKFEKDKDSERRRIGSSFNMLSYAVPKVEWVLISAAPVATWLQETFTYTPQNSSQAEEHK